MFEVDLMKADEVARLFHTTPQKIKAAILNHTLPIGFVADGTQDRIIIIKQRLLAYINADDLKTTLVLNKPTINNTAKS